MSLHNEGSDAESFLNGNKNAGDKSTNDREPGERKKANNGLSINVENLKSTFTGMTKDELMAFATDPFWVRIRHVLFASFWIIWVGMLLTAIYVAVSTPGCARQSLVWYRRSPVYEINLDHLYDNETRIYNKTVFELLRIKITHLNELGIETILLRSALESVESEDEIIDFMKISSFVGSLYNIQELIKFAKEKGIHVLLAFTPNHSSDKNELFARSALMEEDYTSFYVWVPQNTSSKPPNNWLSVYNGSAWEIEKERKQFYLHQFKTTQPDFNFRNPEVITYFENVFRFWMQQGVVGFHLDKTEFLVEDDKLRDEGPSYKPGYTHDQYDYYTHRYTYELPETADVLKKWSDFISNNSGILSVSGGIGERNDIANLVMRSLTLPVNFTAAVLNNTIQSWIRYSKSPAWKWHCKSQSDEECFPETLKDGLTIVSLLLPGVPVTHLGGEFGYPNDYILSDFKNISELFNGRLERMRQTVSGGDQPKTPNSHYDIYKKLMQLRKSSAIMFGQFSAKVLNEAVFCFVRLTANDDVGYLVAWNLAADDVVVNFKNVHSSVREDIFVSIKSNHTFNVPDDEKIPVSSSNFKMPTKGAIVFKFNLR